mmetsp:Transcript_64751/g.189877  ORF Transcript_64751/g.189877 Transcript_64751/m.189877 type:complete len:715 (-) Transcript_64751:86-2230(-)
MAELSAMRAVRLLPRVLAAGMVLTALVAAAWQLAFHENPLGSLSWAVPAMPAPTEDDQTVTLDMGYFRWLWWPFILYLFWGMGYVCDVYFVRTIEVISERFQIPDDVAGATLMALGCNGPEMALNTIAIFKPSDIGIGAVVGGEVFNILVIIGTALLATPAAYMPLRLDGFSFSRDVFFYGLSVGMLYCVLKDGVVTRAESLTLLGGAVLYSTTVAMSARLHVLLQRVWRSKQVRGTRQTIRRVSRMSMMIRRPSEFRPLEDADIDSDNEDKEKLDPVKVMNWTKASQCKDPQDGSVLGIRVDMRNRLMDLHHANEERFMWLREDALIVSAALDPHFGLRRKLGRCASGKDGVVFDYDQRYEGQRWHHGGLVNMPKAFPCDAEAGGEPRPTLLSGGSLQNDPKQPLLDEARAARTPILPGKTPSMMELLDLRRSPIEVIPLEDILYCERSGGDKNHEFLSLHVHQHDDDLGKLITLELNSADTEVLDAWSDALRTSLKAHRCTPTHPPPEHGWLGLLMEWAEWLQFPVKFFLRLTIPDMDKPELQRWYPVSFVMCMTWLALFAYGVVAACDGIHEAFGISEALLGFTVAAAGTSFPNVISGMVVSRQGKTSMAIANALGANVQNVFLALAVPWTIQTCLIRHGPLSLHVEHITPAIIECALTLVPIVGVYLCCSASFPRWAGGVYLLTYVVYLVIAVQQQVKDCAEWPFPCKHR